MKSGRRYTLPYYTDKFVSEMACNMSGDGTLNFTQLAHLLSRNSAWNFDFAVRHRDRRIPPMVELHGRAIFRIGDFGQKLSFLARRDHGSQSARPLALRRKGEGPEGMKIGGNGGRGRIVDIREEEKERREGCNGVSRPLDLGVRPPEPLTLHPTKFIVVKFSQANSRTST